LAQCGRKKTGQDLQSLKGTGGGGEQDPQTATGMAPMSHHIFLQFLEGKAHFKAENQTAHLRGLLSLSKKVGINKFLPFFKGCSNESTS